MKIIKNQFLVPNIKDLITSFYYSLGWWHEDSLSTQFLSIYYKISNVKLPRQLCISTVAYQNKSMILTFKKEPKNETKSSKLSTLLRIFKIWSGYHLVYIHSNDFKVLYSITGNCSYQLQETLKCNKIRWKLNISSYLVLKTAVYEARIYSKVSLNWVFSQCSFQCSLSPWNVTRLLVFTMMAS